ncbi:hypothetical protein KAV79_05280 [Candidatus Aerophobetes bacterium]|nr:hypothetical protein [Candidatus Aerophobetes bacterium]
MSNYWIPTKESAEKITLIQIECALNEPCAELNNRTPFEDTIIHKNASNFFSMSPYLKKTPTFKYYQRMLPLSDREFIYKSVYSKTGGVLNIFNPGIREGMDSELKRLLDKYEDKREAISIWKDTPSELWSSLPPKLVWAGGGDIEGQLLADFLEQLTDGMEGKGFDSKGDCIISSIKFLREWQLRINRACFGGRPIDAIIEERQKIYERKISFLQEMQIETDF